MEIKQLLLLVKVLFGVEIKIVEKEIKLPIIDTAKTNYNNGYTAKELLKYYTSK